MIAQMNATRRVIARAILSITSVLYADDFLLGNYRLKSIKWYYRYSQL